MVDQTLRSTEAKMRTSIGVFKQELTTVRTGHAAPSLIEHVKVEYAGVPTPLIQLAAISAPEASLLVIQPWDKGSISSIEKAILKSDLGLNPSSDGNIIRITIPPLSEERRQELIKVVKRRAEERRVALRSLRHEALDELRKLERDKEISQDEYKRVLERLQRLTDSFISEIEQIEQDKEAELREV